VKRVYREALGSLKERKPSYKEAPGSLKKEKQGITPGYASLGSRNRE